MSTYKTLHEFGMDEIIIEKSTFIGYAKPIKTEEEAIEFINEIMNMNYFVKDTIYEDNVEIIVYSRLEEVKVLTDRMIDITSATAEINLGEEFYLSEQNGNIIL